MTTRGLEAAPGRSPLGEWSWPWLLRVTAAICLFGAEAIHTAVIGVHLRAFAADGLFFFGLSLAEGSLAVALLLRPTERVIRGAFELSLFTIILWVWSRTIGLPPGSPEAIGRADLCSTGFEAVTALALAPMALAPEALRWVARHRHQLIAVAIGVAVAGLARWGLAQPHLHPVGHLGHDPSQFRPGD